MRKACQVELSAEDQKKVDRLLIEARALFDAAVKAELPVTLALALRDRKSFDALGEAEVEGICRFVAQIRKLDLATLETAAAAATPPSKPVESKKTTPKTGIVPDAVLPPPKADDAKK